MISLGVGVLGFVELTRTPRKAYSLQKNYWRIAIFSCVGALYDIVMFVVLGKVIPPGEYGTGIEIIAATAVLILYAPACIITSYRLKRRMHQYNNGDRDISRMNALNCSIVFKVMFVALATIWLVEVR